MSASFADGEHAREMLSLLREIRDRLPAPDARGAAEVAAADAGYLAAMSMSADDVALIAFAREVLSIVADLGDFTPEAAITAMQEAACELPGVRPYEDEPSALRGTERYTKQGVQK